MASDRTRRTRWGLSRPLAVVAFGAMAVAVADRALAQPAPADGPWRSTSKSAPSQVIPVAGGIPTVASPAAPAGQWRSTRQVDATVPQTPTAPPPAPSAQPFGPLPKVPLLPDAKLTPEPLNSAAKPVPSPVPTFTPPAATTPPTPVYAPPPGATPPTPLDRKDAVPPSVPMFTTPAPIIAPPPAKPAPPFQTPVATALPSNLPPTLPAPAPAGPPTLTAPPAVAPTEDPPSVPLGLPKDYAPPKNIRLGQPLPTLPGSPPGGNPPAPTPAVPPNPAPQGSDPQTLPRLDTPSEERLGEPRKLATEDDKDSPKKDKDRDATKVESSAILLKLAQNSARARDYANAIRQFQQYLAKEPKDLDVLVEYAGVLQQADKVEEAIAILEDVARRDPERGPRLLIILSSLHIRARQYGAACARLNEVIQYVEAYAKKDDKKLKLYRLTAAARLGQLQLAEEQFPQADETFKKYFGATKPGDPDLPPALVSLLLDLERTDLALAFLAPLLEADPEDPELLTDKVRAYVQLGDRVQWTAALAALNTKIPQNIEARQELAAALLGSEDFDPAQEAINQALMIRQLNTPPHVPLQITAADLHLRRFQMSQARHELDEIKTTSKFQERDMVLTKAAWFVAAGEYVQAKQHYEMLIQRDFFDYDARLGLGNTHSAAGEFERAKAEFCKVPPNVRQYRAARRAFANTLAIQRRFGQAVDVIEILAREAPWDAQTVVVYLRILERMRDSAKAKQVGNAYLSVKPPTQSAEAAVRAALGRTDLCTGKGVDAESNLKIALKLSNGKSVTAIYGLTKVGFMFDDPGRFPLAFARDGTFDELRYRILLSDLFAEDNDDLRSLDFAKAAQRIDPMNPASMTRVADGCLRVARQTGNVSDAVHAAKGVLAMSTVNTRGFLTLARAYSIGQNYPAAIDAYNKLLSADRDAVTPKRELARMYYADHYYDMSKGTYQTIAAEADPAKAFRATLQAMAVQLPPSLRPGLDGLAVGDLPPEKLKVEVEKMAAGSKDPFLAAGLQAAAADYEARQAEAKGADLEGRAKAAKGFRDLSAIPVYRQLIAYEPDNTDAMFDVGQIYSQRLMTQSALTQYGELMAADPAHREAAIASSRHQADDSPTYRFNTSFEKEFGFNGLNNISRLRVGNFFTVPIGDENEYVGFGYTRIELYPPPGTPNQFGVVILPNGQPFTQFFPAQQGGQLGGNIPTFLYQQRLAAYDQVLFKSVINVEQYQSRVSTRPTGEFGLINYGDGLTTEAFLFLNNVLENGQSLVQDIYRYGGRLSAEYQCTRRFDVGGLVRVAGYSDANTLLETNAHAGYLLCYAPTQLRFVVSANTISFSNVTQFGPFAAADPNNLVGTVHPYFAPSGFSYYDAIFDWRHWLSRDYFSHANQCYYTIQPGIRVDNRSNTYGLINAAVNYDISTNATVGAEARGVYSGVYKFGSIGFYFVWRMPFITRF